MSGFVRVSCESHSVEYIVVTKYARFSLIGGPTGFNEASPNIMHTSESDATTT